MSPEQAAKFRYSVNDLTKIWPHDQFPLRKIAKFTLNKNPENYFADIEQAAFAPSHLLPGMEPSNDPVLQSRLFSYPDAQRYRLGVNYKTLPVNCPFATSNYQRSGVMVTDANGGSAPNYPSSSEPMKYAKRPYTLAQIADKHEGAGVISTTSEITDLDFEQPRALYERVFDEGARQRLIQVCSIQSDSLPSLDPPTDDPTVLISEPLWAHGSRHPAPDRRASAQALYSRLGRLGQASSSSPQGGQGRRKALDQRNAHFLGWRSLVVIELA